MTRSQKHNQSELPTETEASLRRLYGGDSPADPESRGFLLDLAGERLGPGHRPLPIRKPLAMAASVALVLIGGLLWVIWDSSAPNTRTSLPGSQSAMIAGDADGNGAVDVRDAFLVARGIRDGSATDPAWDLIADGTIDGADVQRIMTIAVTLPAGGEQ